MDAIDIVEVDVLAEHAMKMPLVEHNHMIEQLPAHAQSPSCARSWPTVMLPSDSI